MDKDLFTPPDAQPSNGADPVLKRLNELDAKLDAIKDILDEIYEIALDVDNAPSAYN